MTSTSGRTFSATVPAVAVFFGAKITLAILLVKISADALTVDGFATFSQLFLFSALLNQASVGLQNGLIKLVAVARTGAETSLALRAALLLWTAFGASVVLICATFASPLSIVLTSSASDGQAIIWIAVGAIVAGYGQMYVAVITAQQRIVLSLSLQGAGLLVSTLGAIYWLSAGEPVWAACAAAWGYIVTWVLAWALSKLSRIPLSAVPASATIAILAKNSIAFLIVSSLMPIALFAIRYFYREQFGTEVLSYWLVANRVSDVTSQLLGLLMRQLFLPAAAAPQSYRAARRLTVRVFALGTVVMLAGFLVFISAPIWFVVMFLSSQYVPAIPMIGAYLLGDVLRVATVIASHTAVARQSLATYIGIEFLTVGIFSVLSIAMIASGRVDGPYVAYVLSFGILTAVFASIFLSRARRQASC